MSKSLTNLIYFDLSDRIGVASEKIVQSEAKIINNVIQLADVRRAKLDKIAAQNIDPEVAVCLRIASSFPTHRSKADFLRRVLSRIDTSRADGRVGEIRQALRDLGEAV